MIRILPILGKNQSLCLSAYFCFTFRDEYFIKSDLLLMHFCEVAPTSFPCQIECEHTSGAMGPFDAAVAAAAVIFGKTNDFAELLEKLRPCLKE